MAGIDYTIPGQFKGVQIEPPENAMARAMQLRGLQEASQLNALKMQEYQQDVMEKNELAKIYADPKLKYGSEEFFTEVSRRAPRFFEKIATGEAQRQTALSTKQQREAATDKNKFEIEQAQRKEERDAVDLRLKQFNDQFPAYSIQSEQDVEDRILAMANDEVLGPLSTRFGPLGDTIARNKAEYRRDPRNYIARMSGVSAEKILEAAEKKDATEYSEYRLNELVNRRTPMPRDDYFKAKRGGAVAPAAVAPAEATAAAAPEEKAPPVGTAVSVESKPYGVDLIDPEAQNLLLAAASATNPAEKEVLTKLAEKIQTESAARRRNTEYTGTFQNADIALRELERLKKEEPTPENQNRIKVLQGLIDAAQVPLRPPAPTEISKKENELEDLQQKLDAATDPNKKKTLRNRIARLKADISGDVYGREKTPATTPVQDALISKAILDGRLDPGKVNSRNIAVIARTLEMDPNANLKELNIDAMSANAASKALAIQSAKILTAVNEAKSMMQIVKTVSDKIDRTQYPTINAIQNAVDKGTGGKEIVQLNAAINALVNAYARAINPSGVSTVRDKEHAREVINSNYSKGQLDAILDIMTQEMALAQKAPGEASMQLKEQRNAPRPAGTVDKNNKWLK